MVKGHTSRHGESELMRQLRLRVDALTNPHREIYGDDAPVVRMALHVLAAAEDLEEELAGRRYSTAEASDRSGWTPETLQKYARLRLDGADMPRAWAGLLVWETPGGYSFALGSIPENPRVR